MGVFSFDSFDERTHVGRQNVFWEQTHMYKRVHGVKSTVDTKPPRSAVGAPFRRAEIDAFREVREAARRINDLNLRKRAGVTTFTSSPKSMALSKRLSENRAAHRAADPSRAFHAKQVANMRRRIAEQNTLVERKKNVYDPNVYPVVTRPKSASASRRMPPWGFGSGRLSSAAARPASASRPAASASRPATARASPSAATQKTTPGSASRPATARASPGAATQKTTFPGTAHMRPTRKPAREHPAYQTLRKKLLREIVAEDASEEDVAEIFARATREQSGSQHKHVLRAVIADLEVELELEA